MLCFYFTSITFGSHLMGICLSFRLFGLTSVHFYKRLLIVIVQQKKLTYQNKPNCEYCPCYNA